MDLLSAIFFVFVIGAPVGVGAFAVFFNRRFSLGALRFRKAVWKIDFSDFDIRAGRVFAVVVGTVLLIGGLAAAAQLLT